MRVPLTQITPDMIFGLSRARLERAVADLTFACEAKWKGIANRELKTSRQAYVGSLRHFISGLRGVVALMPGPKSRIAAMVEKGHPGFDMRVTLLRTDTRNIRRSAAGHLYLSVPFRHMTPGTSGEMGTPMGEHFIHAGRSGGQVQEGAAMGRAVYQAAEGLGPTRTRPAQWNAAGRSGGQVWQPERTSWGGRLGEGVGGAMPLRAHHVTDPYAGMVNLGKQYEKSDDSTYMTWRTISNNPESMREGGWRHPGIQARHLVDKVVPYAQEEWPRILREAMRN